MNDSGIGQLLAAIGLTMMSAGYLLVGIRVACAGGWMVVAGAIRQKPQLAPIRSRAELRRLAVERVKARDRLLLP